jgi:hypothetical protein
MFASKAGAFSVGWQEKSFVNTPPGPGGHLSSTSAIEIEKRQFFTQLIALEYNCYDNNRHIIGRREENQL